MNNVWYNIFKIKKQRVFSSLLCGFLGSFSVATAGNEPRQDVIREIITKKNELGIDKSFNFFDVHLSEHEHEILETLHIKAKRPLSIYGNHENNEHDIAAYLESLGNSCEHSQCAAAIIHRFIVESCNACGSAGISVMIRSMPQTDQYDIPRWHFDSLPDLALKGLSTKIVCALKGPGTVFSPISAAVRDEYLHVSHQIDIEREQQFMNDELIDKKTVNQTRYNISRSYDIEPRKQLAQLLAPYEVRQAATRQGTLFVIGDPLHAAVHSEPPIHEDRLLIAIIPGTVEQIKALQYLETGK